MKGSSVMLLALAFLTAANGAERDGADTRHSAREAGTSACYTISSPDLRNLCRARVTNDSSACYTIMDPDQRAYCRALISGAAGGSCVVCRRCAVCGRS